jgi:hypothetical protein
MTATKQVYQDINQHVDQQYRSSLVTSFLPQCWEAADVTGVGYDINPHLPRAQRHTGHSSSRLRPKWLSIPRLVHYLWWALVKSSALNREQGAIWDRDLADVVAVQPAADIRSPSGVHRKSIN